MDFLKDYCNLSIGTKHGDLLFVILRKALDCAHGTVDQRTYHLRVPLEYEHCSIDEGRQHVQACVGGFSRRSLAPSPPDGEAESAEDKQDEEGGGGPEGHEPEGGQRVGRGLRYRRAGVGESARPGGKGAHDSSLCTHVPTLKSGVHRNVDAHY